MNMFHLRQLEQEAMNRQLGQPIAYVVGRPQPVSRLCLIALGVGLLLCIILVWLLPVLGALLPLWQVILCFVIASCWFVTGLWWLLSWLFTRRGIQPLLCRHGLVWRYDSVHSFQWQEIESLWCYPISRSWTRYEIRLHEKHVLVLDSRIRGAEQLARHIEQVMIGRHLPSLMQAYQHGATLVFGPLSMSQCGIQILEQDVLKWDQIKDIRPLRGVLTMYSKHTTIPWATIDLSAIPNVCLAEALILKIHVLNHTLAFESPLERGA